MLQIHFGHLSIAKVANSSGIFTGENVLYGRVYQGKKTEGFGETIGQNNQLLWNRQIVVDTDVVDQVRGYQRKESG